MKTSFSVLEAYLKVTTWMPSYQSLRRSFRQFYCACCISIFCLHPVWADDTEIFFSPVTGAELQPNILFVLDASLSMRKKDGGTSSRLQRMNDALIDIIKKSNNVNIGVMRLSGREAGGRVIYPVRNINQQLCNGVPCDDSTGFTGTITTVRQELLDVINEIELDWGTPTVGALLEASDYFAGNDVRYGKVRWYKDIANRRETGYPSRVSHRDSYRGEDSVLPRGCTSENLSNPACSEEFIPGNPIYISPIKNECQSNHMVLVTDGLAVRDRPAVDRATKMVTSCPTHTSNNGRCAVEIADYLNITDLNSDIDGDQTVTTHTIGFNIQSDWLKDIAITEERYYEAESSADLVTAISAIIGNVETVDATFVSPGITVDQFTRLSHRNDVYLALFKPSNTPMWQGNLKRYDLKGASLTDANENIAVDSTTGQFKPDSRSFWSATADGADISLGGAASRLPDYNNRKVVTYTGTNKELFDDTNTLNTANTALELFATDLNSEERNEIINLIEWARGKDLKDADKDKITDENRFYMGDPLHSQPVIINYEAPETTETTDPFESVAFVGTNEGFLHAINTNTGEEEFAFMPEILTHNLGTLYQNKKNVKKVYGMDGDLTLWSNDSNNNGTISTTEGDHAYLYAGMRRGGNNYFALDVSIRDNPKYMFSIPESDPDAFAELGQTWSKPILADIKVGSEVKKVLIFGGGYDESQDDKDIRLADRTGRAIYIVDASNGTLIWGGQPNTVDDKPIKAFTEMQYSIPSDIKLVNDNDGLASQLYVGDMGGQVWRFDIKNGNTGTALVDGGVIAELAESDDTSAARRFFHAPDLSLSAHNGETILNLAIGSGYHAHPLDKQITDYFYLIRYPFEATGNYGISSSGTYEPIEADDLFDTTDNTIGDGEPGEIAIAQDTLNNHKEGWLIEMERTGEKILGSSVTLDHIVRFISYAPTAKSNLCEPGIGQSFYYQVNIADGTPVDNREPSSDPRNPNEPLVQDDRWSAVPGAGLAPPVQTVFVATEDGNITPIDVSGINVLNEGTIDNGVRRWFWAEVPE